MILSPPTIGRLASGLLLTVVLGSQATAQTDADADEAAEQAEEAAENAAEQAEDAAEQTEDAAEQADESIENQEEAVDEAVENAVEETNSMSDRRRRQVEALPDVGTLADEPKTKKFYSAIGAGKTLPKGVMRVRLPYQNVYGKEGFDEEGNKESQGIEINIDAMALAVEYGLTDKISLAILAPFVLRSEAGLNANEIRKNNRKFKREFGRYAEAVQDLLRSQDLCSSTEDCMAKIYSDQYRIPVNQTVTLTTGETVTATTDAPIYRQIDALLMQPITPAEGKTGIGDITIGGLYNFYADKNISLSAGGGLRIPTGEFTDVAKGERPTGGGILDLGLRFNFDYKAAPWAVVSFQHQFEQMLAPGEKKKPSSIYNDQLNQADPTTPQAIAIGSDGFDNNQKFERFGVGHDGFIRVGFGLTDIAQALAPVGLGLKYRWFEGRETRYDGQAIDSEGWRKDEITRLRYLGFNVSWDGLGMDPLIPLSLNYEYERPVSGSFATVAPITNRFQVIGYYKF